MHDRYLRKGVKENGVAALIHKNQGREPAKCHPRGNKQKIINFKMCDVYKDICRFFSFICLIISGTTWNTSPTMP